MRIIVSIAAFLIMLGLAAFGIISAQKVTAASQMTASVSSATAGSQTASTALRRTRSIQSTSSHKTAPQTHRA